MWQSEKSVMLPATVLQSHVLQIACCQQQFSTFIRVSVWQKAV
jgi:hypothetical protein